MIVFLRPDRRAIGFGAAKATPQSLDEAITTLTNPQGKKQVTLSQVCAFAIRFVQTPGDAVRFFEAYARTLAAQRKNATYGFPVTSGLTTAELAYNNIVEGAKHFKDYGPDWRKTHQVKQPMSANQMAWFKAALIQHVNLVLDKL